MSSASSHPGIAEGPAAPAPVRSLSRLLQVAGAKLGVPRLGLASLLRMYGARFQGALAYIEALAITPGLWLSPPKKPSRQPGSPQPPGLRVRLFAQEGASPPQAEGVAAPSLSAGPSSVKARSEGRTRGVPRDPEFYASQGIVYEQGVCVNARGMELATMHWAPAHREPLALVFLLHGYGVDCGIFWEDVGARVAKAGFAVFGIDYEGHGQSDGLHGYVASVSQLADDVSQHYKSIAERSEFQGKKRFLMGHSMGGAMSILLSWRLPTTWDGAVLLAPMVKISEKLKPPEAVVTVLRMLERVAPTWAIFPTGDVFAKSARDPRKREKIRDLPTTYRLKPRLHTILEMKNVCDLIESKLPEVVVPFLVLHGGHDVLVESSISEELYAKASSSDKSIKIYPEMWHCLTVGEMDANIDLVFEDALSWISERLEA